MIYHLAVKKITESSINDDAFQQFIPILWQAIL